MPAARLIEELGRLEHLVDHRGRHLARGGDAPVFFVRRGAPAQVEGELPEVLRRADRDGRGRADWRFSSGRCAAAAGAAAAGAARAGVAAGARRARSGPSNASDKPATARPRESLDRHERGGIRGSMRIPLASPDKERSERIERKPRSRIQGANRGYQQCCPSHKQKIAHDVYYCLIRRFNPYWIGYQSFPRLDLGSTGHDIPVRL